MLKKITSYLSNSGNSVLIDNLTKIITSLVIVITIIISFWQFRKQTEFELHKPLMELRIKMYSDILSESAKFLPAMSKPIDTQSLNNSNEKLKNLYYDSFVVLGDPSVNESFVQLINTVDEIVDRQTTEGQTAQNDEFYAHQSLLVVTDRSNLAKCISFTLKKVLNVQFEEMFQSIDSLKQNPIYCRLPESDKYRILPTYYRRFSNSH